MLSASSETSISLAGFRNPQTVWPRADQFGATAPKFMKTATVVIKTESFGNHVTLRGVTPPELMFLTAMYKNQVQGDPILSVTPEFKMIDELIQDRDPTGAPMFGPDKKPILVEGKVPTTEPNEVNWSFSDERKRLCHKYQQKLVMGFFPGGMPQMPKNFEEAKEAGLQSDFEGFSAKDRPVF